MRRAIGWMVALALIVIAGLVAWGILRGRPQDLPWTPLDLSQPIGMFTGRKVAGLGDEPAQCRALLTKAGVHFTALPAHHDGTSCGYDDAVRFTPGGARAIALRPAGLGVACPVAAGLAMWEWNVVQPAAQRLLGTHVTAIEHFGSYSCRRMYGRDEGSWSEHATADAVDIAGFVLANGRRITVASDWRSKDTSDAAAENEQAPEPSSNRAAQEARFLRTVRDGACRLFATVLSPEYNAAHRDHLHLDQAARGATGWRACR